MIEQIILMINSFFCFCIVSVSCIKKCSKFSFISSESKVHQAVIDAGDVESGCTIHQVTEKVDSGPIIIQKSVKVCLRKQSHESVFLFFLMICDISLA